MSSKQPFDDPRIPIDERVGERIRERLGDREFRDLTDALESQREDLADLETRLSEVQTERDRLRTRVDSLTQEISDLEERLNRDSPDVHFDASDVFQRFGGAVEDAQRRLREENRAYEVGNVRVHLRANVVGDDSGLKLQFPGERQRMDAGSIGEFDFDLRPTSTPDVGTYDEIPSLEGRDVQTAMRMIADRGFEGEVVERRKADEPNVVLDQFPRARSIAEPGTTVDLIASEPLPDEESETAEDEVEETDDSVTDTDENGTDDAGNGEADEREETRSGGDEESDADGDDERTARLQLEVISGIGTAYSKRLRGAGIDDVIDLAESPPRRVADRTGISPTRIETWVEQARRISDREGR